MLRNVRLTINTFRLFSFTQLSKVKTKQGFSNRTDNQTFGFMDDNKKIMLLISSIFCIVFVLLIWKKVRCQTEVKYIFIWLVLLLIGILYNIRSR